MSVYGDSSQRRSLEWLRAEPFHRSRQLCCDPDFVVNQPALFADWNGGRRFADAIFRVLSGETPREIHARPRTLLASRQERDIARVIDLVGPLDAEPSGWLSEVGGTSLSEVESEINQATRDPATRIILLAVDSPGGSERGLASVLQSIYRARIAGKLVVSHIADGARAYGTAAWIACAADATFGGPLSRFGHFRFRPRETVMGGWPDPALAGRGIDAFFVGGKLTDPVEFAERQLVERQIEICVECARSRHNITAQTKAARPSLSGTEFERLDESSCIGEQAESFRLIDGLLDFGATLERAANAIGVMDEWAKLAAAGGPLEHVPGASGLKAGVPLSIEAVERARVSFGGEPPESDDAIVDRWTTPVDEERA